jgi:isocitrate dehydrogenase kinase/phosphatase
VFESAHESLLKVNYWQQAQRDVKTHVVKQIYPYPAAQRFYQHIE